uniref:hypothetical protein n=1 Tax=uncultured Halomonas sp. TaxID=173971 RepID=UPI00262E77A8|nr:hypothetical protein [uncultured Halomonas sp.]
MFVILFSIADSLIIFFIGLIFSAFVPKLLNVRQKTGMFLYLWHTVWCLVCAWFIMKDGGDALKYYADSLGEGYVSFRPGSPSVINFTRFFTSNFGVSFYGMFLVNNIIGYVGVLAFFASLNAVTIGKGRFVGLMAFGVVMLPSVSFWSSAIGKDSISFLATGLALWAAIDLKRRIGLMPIAVILMLIVRPHIAAILVLGLSVAFVLHAKVSLAQRVALGVLSLFFAAIITPFSLEYAGVGETVDIESLTDYVEGRQGLNLRGGGSVDISSMSLPMQMITYVFRPFIFEARSSFQLISAAENILILLIFILGIRSYLHGSQSPVNDTRVFMWAFSILAWVALSMTTANLGIASRQKWMFVPFLVYLMISVIDYRTGKFFARQEVQKSNVNP